MENNSFYLKLAAALLLSISSASILVSGSQYRGAIAALVILSAMLLVRSAEKKSLATGRTDRMKVALSLSTVLYELVIFLGAFSLPIVPKSVAAITLAAISFNEILYLETEQKLRSSFSPDVGRTGRMLVISVALLAYSANSFYLFYGLLFISLLAIYDSLRLLHKVSRELN